MLYTASDLVAPQVEIARSGTIRGRVGVRLGIGNMMSVAGGELQALSETNAPLRADVEVF